MRPVWITLAAAVGLAAVLYATGARNLAALLLALAFWGAVLVGGTLLVRRVWRSGGHERPVPPK